MREGRDASAIIRRLSPIAAEAFWKYGSKYEAKKAWELGVQKVQLTHTRGYTKLLGTSLKMVKLQVKKQSLMVKSFYMVSEWKKKKIKAVKLV